MNGAEQKFFDERFIELKTEFRVFKNTYNESEKRRTVRVDEIFNRIDGVKESISELQCGVHEERMKSIKGQIAWLWALVLLNISAIGTGFWIMLRLKG